MNRRVAAALLLLTTLALPLHADFATIARKIEDQRGVKRIWIPFLGLARVMVWAVSPEGVHDFQLATFEGAGDVDPHWLHELMRTQAGPGYMPLVQTWSRRSNEWSFIYAKPTPNGERFELLILTRDDDDTVLVRVAVDASVIARELRDRPSKVSDMARR